MCGRFTLTASIEDIQQHFGVLHVPSAFREVYRPRFNVAPGQDVLTVVAMTPETLNGARTAAAAGAAPGGSASLNAGSDVVRTLRWHRWGLIPPWAKEPSIGYRMINARSETVAQKPSFRHAFRRRRCLVPADGFYEWRTEGRRKVPFRFRMRDGSLFALAGLWETWTPPDGGEPITSCTVLTTDANDVVAPVHHRMPVIIPPDHYDTWLDPEEEPEALKALLSPYPPSAMEGYAVSTEVNSARNDYPELIKPLETGHEPLSFDLRHPE